MNQFLEPFLKDATTLLQETGSFPFTVAYRTKTGELNKKSFDFQSPEEKEHFIQVLLYIIHQQQITEIAIIFESWMAMIPISNPTATELAIQRTKKFGVRNDPDRQEALILHYETRVGADETYICKLSRLSSKSALVEEPVEFPSIGMGRFINLFKQSDDMAAKVTAFSKMLSKP